MKAVSRAAARVLDRLTTGLDADGQATRIDNAPGSFMRVCVERIGSLGDMGPLFSIAHYHEQLGDLMADPEMIFLRGADGGYYPTYYKQDGLGVERESVRVDGGRVLVNQREQADQARFADGWMSSIEQQQFNNDRSKT